MTGLFNDFSTSGAAGGAWRGDAAALARWGLGAYQSGRRPCLPLEHGQHHDGERLPVRRPCARRQQHDRGGRERRLSAGRNERRAGQHADQLAGRCSLRGNGRGLDVEHSGSQQAGRNGLDGEQRLHHSAFRDGPTVHRGDGLQPRPAQRRLRRDADRRGQGPHVVQQDHRTRELRRPLCGRHRPTVRRARS